MSATLNNTHNIVLSNEDETINKEARRLFSTMFGQLLEDDAETPSFIFDRLYLGSVVDARNFAKLKEYHIRYVLNMAGLTSYPNDFFATSSYPDVTLLSINAHDVDDYNITEDFPLALNFIHRALRATDGAILVHCSAGVSRSATIVAAYLMATKKIGVREAVLQVHQARPCVCPSMSFLRQLLRFDYMKFKFTSI